MEIVEEEALSAICKQKKTRRVGLDAYGECGNPPYKNSRLMKLDKLMLVPHIGGVTAECILRNFYARSVLNMMPVVEG